VWVSAGRILSEVIGILPIYRSFFEADTLTGKKKKRNENQENHFGIVHFLTPHPLLADENNKCTQHKPHTQRRRNPLSNPGLSSIVIFLYKFNSPEEHFKGATLLAVTFCYYKRGLLIFFTVSGAMISDWNVPDHPLIRSLRPLPF
jgi:hypothetical protein